MNTNHLIREIVQLTVNLKAIIQDIDDFCGTINDLKELNEAGRLKISTLRKKLNHLDELCQDSDDHDLIADVSIQRKEVTNVLVEFKNANINAMIRLEGKSRESLMAYSKRPAAKNENSRDHVIQQHSKITDKLREINCQLEQTTKQSFETLDALFISSQTIQNTDEELVFTSSSIKQSGKLLDKFGQREITDKILMYLFTGFFIACVFYVVQKRLF